jgi:hypothetical protein
MLFREDAELKQILLLLTSLSKEIQEQSSFSQ